MTYGKKILFGGVLLSVIGVIICFLYLPDRIDCNLTGWCWSEETGESREISVYVDGWYWKSACRNNIYDGWMTISEDPIMMHRKVKQQLGEGTDSSVNHFSPIVWDPEQERWHDVGVLYERDSFSEICGFLDNGFRFAVPSNNLDDAKGLLNDILSGR